MAARGWWSLWYCTAQQWFRHAAGHYEIKEKKSRKLWTFTDDINHLLSIRLLHSKLFSILPNLSKARCLTWPGVSLSRRVAFRDYPICSGTCSQTFYSQCSFLSNLFNHHILPFYFESGPAENKNITTQLWRMKRGSSFSATVKSASFVQRTFLRIRRIRYVNS